MNALNPPLAVVERDDDEFSFYSSVEEMLDDRHDILWGAAYDGWDSSGQYFTLIRREGSRRWWHSLLSSERTFLAVESVQPGILVNEALARMNRQLKTAASDLPALLRIGVERERLEAVKQ